MSTARAYSTFVPAGLRRHLPEMSKQSRAAVYLLLGSMLDEDGKCYPSVEWVAETLGIDIKTARKAIQWLAFVGLVLIESRPGRKPYYRLSRLKVDGGVERQGNPSPAVVPLPLSGTPTTERYPYHAEVAHPSLPVVVHPSHGVVPEGINKKGNNREGNNKREPAAPGPLRPEVCEASSDQGEGVSSTTSDQVVSDALTSTQKRQGSSSSKKLKTRQAAVGQGVTEEPADGVTDDAIRSSIGNLIGWLGFGKPGVVTPPSEWASLKPTPSNWFAHVLPDLTGLFTLAEDATPLQAAAFAWAALNQLRHREGMPILKPGYQRDLIGHRNRPSVLGTLYAERGASGVLKHVQAVSERYADVLAGLAWMSDGPPPLDAGFFRHGAVIKQADKLAAAAAEADTDSNDIDEMIERYA